MPNSRTSEDNDLDLWEDDDIDDEELNDDDDEFDYESLSASEKKRYNKIKQQVEDSVVKALSEGDTESPVYKGMQKVVARKDRELQQYQQALAGVIQQVQQQGERGEEVEFLREIVKDMLDDDSRKVFEDKFERFNEKRKGSKQEQLLQALLNQQGQQQIPAYGRNEEDPQITQYRKEATNKLKAFAKRMGADPEKDNLDFGDEDEALLVRMDKLAASIERVTSEREERELSGVRRRGNQPNTRTRNDQGSRDSEFEYGRSILEKGSNALLKKMLKA